MTTLWPCQLSRSLHWLAEWQPGEGVPYKTAYTQNTGTEPLTKPGLSHRAAGARQQVCLTAKVPPRVHPSASKPL
jgi:hypothetical protein